MDILERRGRAITTFDNNLAELNNVITDVDWTREDAL
jgi:hypothetical protein